MYFVVIAVVKKYFAELPTSSDCKMCTLSRSDVLHNNKQEKNIVACCTMYYIFE
jgi:hypothetical protein